MPLRIEAVGPRGLLRREVGRGGLGPIPAEREEEVLPVDGEGLDRPLAYVVAHLDVPVGKTMETDKKKHELGRFMTLEEAAEVPKSPMPSSVSSLPFRYVIPCCHETKGFKIW